MHFMPQYVFTSLPKRIRIRYCLLQKSAQSANSKLCFKGRLWKRKCRYSRHLHTPKKHTCIAECTILVYKFINIRGCFYFKKHFLKQTLNSAKNSYFIPKADTSSARYQTPLKKKSETVPKSKKLSMAKLDFFKEFKNLYI